MVITLKHLKVKNVLSQWSRPYFSTPRANYRRRHDERQATIWHRLGFGNPRPADPWTPEDELASVLAAQIADEIEREILEKINGTM